MLSWHATATINSSLALGDDGFGPKWLSEPSIASILGTAATICEQEEKACRTSRTLLARARTRAHTTSERLSSRGSLTEPGLRQRRRERVPHELLLRCFRSGTPLEPCLEVLPRSCLLDGQISLSKWLPTDEPCCRQFDSNTCSWLEQVPACSRTRLVALASES